MTGKKISIIVKVTYYIIQVQCYPLRLFVQSKRLRSMRSKKVQVAKTW